MQLPGHRKYVKNNYARIQETLNADVRPHGGPLFSSDTPPRGRHLPGWEAWPRREGLQSPEQNVVLLGTNSSVKLLWLKVSLSHMCIDTGVKLSHPWVQVFSNVLDNGNLLSEGVISAYTAHRKCLKAHFFSALFGIVRIFLWLMWVWSWILL